VNTVITVALLSIFVSMASSTSDAAKMDQLASIGNWLVGLVSFAFSFLLIFYGTRLTCRSYFQARDARRALNPVAKRVLAYAFSLFACFAGAALILVAGELTKDTSDTPSIVYFSLDCMAYIIGESTDSHCRCCCARSALCVCSASALCVWSDAVFACPTCSDVDASRYGGGDAGVTQAQLAAVPRADERKLGDRE
jgi:hypothetical protein